jgi:hypothetical protein
MQQLLQTLPVVFVAVLARYPVRMVVVDLQDPPPWFSTGQASDHMSLQEARAFAGTDGEGVCFLTWGV